VKPTETEFRRLTARIAAAQQEDGYLNTGFGNPGQEPHYLAQLAVEGVHGAVAVVVQEERPRRPACSRSGPLRAGRYRCQEGLLKPAS
jgi:hypothetical protein